MRTLVTFIILMTTSTAFAGAILRVSPSEATNFFYGYDSNGCLSFTMTIQQRDVKGGPYCAGQAIIKDELFAFLTSPRQERCLKYESCYARRCQRFYGQRQVTYKMMFIVEGDGRVRNFRLLPKKSECL